MKGRRQPERMTAADYRALLLGREPRTKRPPKPRAHPEMTDDDMRGLPEGPRVILHFPPVAASPNWHGPAWVKRKAQREYLRQCHRLALEAGFHRLRDALRKGPIKMSVRVDFYPPANGRTPDQDNSVAAFKHGQDGIAQALMVDDGRFNNIYHWHGERRGAVVVTLVQIPEEDTCTTAKAA